MSRWTVRGDDKDYVHGAQSPEETQYKDRQYKDRHTSPYVSKHASSKFIEQLD